MLARNIKKCVIKYFKSKYKKSDKQGTSEE